MIHARIERLIFAATEPKAGAVVSQLHSFDLAHVNHRPAVTAGVLAAECSEQLSGFLRPGEQLSANHKLGAKFLSTFSLMSRKSSGLLPLVISSSAGGSWFS